MIHPTPAPTPRPHPAHRFPIRLLAVAAAVTTGLLTFAGPAGGQTRPLATTASGCLPAQDSAEAGSALGRLTAAQIRQARTVYDVAAQAQLPPRAAVIALATALRESRLRNLANANVPESLRVPHDGVGGDHGSVGLFQQRSLPFGGKGGWGAVEELMTPRVAATKFYAALLTVPDWEQLPLTVAAQQVQRSALPDAYAEHEPLATALALAFAEGGLTCGVSSSPVSAQGWTAPLHGRATSDFRTPDRPTHQGVDLAAPKGAPIYAAAAGTVLIARCDQGDCDVDGTLDTPGYGWYVDIFHADHTVTRYAHLLRRPYVHVGQRVPAGLQLGVVGSSGHSTGPHLHFETHAGPSATTTNAVDPYPFLAARGVDLSRNTAVGSP
ncbi:M23 family metallopeptidase [Catellatospora vulcania]|uniref:M23 family metallopeptidase n=1 Tax=Catellatospora vulcania TaxID=1460450 RepID=UPI0012D43328|nr:M23 family metallopeptidase [Catellatospora vulcania]